MGLYMYISKEDTVRMRNVSNAELNEDLQEALKYDPSIMIEETNTESYTGFLRRRLVIKTSYIVYHEYPAHDGSLYQARLQSSASGDHRTIRAYLHGVINGCAHFQTLKQKQ